MEPADVDTALAVASQWLDTVDGVVSVGQGDAGGVATVDVWITGAATDFAGVLPESVHGCPVRIREAGGAVEPR